MPRLNWLKRDEDMQAAARVPYRLLEEATEHSAGEAHARNLLIQGDNLEALKALLPFYAGPVSCVYGSVTPDPRWSASPATPRPRSKATLETMCRRPDGAPLFDLLFLATGPRHAQRRPAFPRRLPLRPRERRLRTDPARLGLALGATGRVRRQAVPIQRAGKGMSHKLITYFSVCAVQRRHSSAGANPARQLSLQPVAVGADDGGNDIV